ncbi:MAG: acyl-CoA dehydrogenase [Afipia sp.]|nr:acyl-CoA dehydrogenase [Afipia sp.]
MSEAESIIAETADRIFSDLADALTINRATSNDWQRPLWTALTEAGLPLSWVAEELGGSGISLAEGFSVIAAAGRHALPVPLVETMVAGWLLAQAGIASPENPMTVAPSSPRDRIFFNSDGLLKGRARGIPFAKDTKHIAVIAETGKGFIVALVSASACRIEAGESLGGDTSNNILFDGAKPVMSKPAPLNFTPMSLMMMGAAARSLQIAGALETLLNLSVAYANERVAFGKKIGSFQAIQHNLAQLAGEVAAALTASGSAADAMAADPISDDALLLEVAAAKIRCAEAAEKGAAIAHQVYGAIGFSREHILHRYSLRALAWRDDFGHETYWATELGKSVSARGADELWPLVASR